MNRRCLILLPICALLFAIATSLALAGDENEPMVLTIDPAKLPQAQTDIGPDLARDPFNWPPEQIARFRELDRGKRSGLFAGLNLTGIIWDQRKPLAVINGKMVGVGEWIKGAEVKKIHKESVVLRKDGANFTLEFQPLIIGIEPKKEDR